MLRRTYILDLDGTVFDLTHRLHHILKEPKDWHAFHSNVLDDAPIQEVIDVVQSVVTHRLRNLVVITGRSETSRADTVKALGLIGLHPDLICMRPEGDKRPDYILKLEIYNRLKEVEPHLDVVGVFEDRQSVVDMWREQGLRVFQVDKGNF